MGLSSLLEIFGYSSASRISLTPVIALLSILLYCPVHSSQLCPFPCIASDSCLETVLIEEIPLVSSSLPHPSPLALQTVCESQTQHDHLSPSISLLSLSSISIALVYQQGSLTGRLLFRRRVPNSSLLSTPPFTHSLSRPTHFDQLLSIIPFDFDL